MESGFIFDATLIAGIAALYTASYYFAFSVVSQAAIWAAEWIKKKLIG